MDTLLLSCIQIALFDLCEQLEFNSSASENDLTCKTRKTFIYEERHGLKCLNFRLSIFKCFNNENSQINIWNYIIMYQI